VRRAGLRRSGPVVAENQGVLDARARRALRPLDRGRDEPVVRRELADGVRVRWIAGQQVRLAAAAAEVAGPLGAAAARLLHPSLAAEAIERVRVVPDLANPRGLHVRELEPRQDSRRLARE